MSGSTAGQAGAERERVALAVQELLDDLVADDPVLATTLGLPEGAGRLPIEKFSKTYRLADINQAIDDAHHGKCIKAVLTID